MYDAETKTDVDNKDERPINETKTCSDIVRRGVPKCAGVYAEGTVNDVDVWFTMDTGAARTIVSNKVFEQIRDKPIAKKDRDLPLAQASGSPQSNIGVATLNMKMGQVELCKKVPVADIQDDVLVGMDISNEFDVLTSKRKAVLEGKDSLV